MQRKLEGIKGAQQLEKERYQELLLEIKSQSDPAWIELILMRELGLVPEGQTKVYFIPSS